MRAPPTTDGSFPIRDVHLYPARVGKDVRGVSLQLGSPSWAQPPWPTLRFLVVRNPARYTLRGLHFKEPGTRKVVACVTGCAFDVLVDLRPDSSTYRHWQELVLFPGDALDIPSGVAHGYMTVEPDTILAYVLEGTADDDRGLRWDDPLLEIAWPAKPEVISERDGAWPFLQREDAK